MSGLHLLMVLRLVGIESSLLKSPLLQSSTLLHTCSWAVLRTCTQYPLLYVGLEQLVELVAK